MRHSVWTWGRVAEQNPGTFGMDVRVSTARRDNPVENSSPAHAVAPAFRIRQRKVRGLSTRSSADEPRRGGPSNFSVASALLVEKWRLYTKASGAGGGAQGCRLPALRRGRMRHEKPRAVLTTARRPVRQRDRRKVTNETDGRLAVGQPDDRRRLSRRDRPSGGRAIAGGRRRRNCGSASTYGVRRSEPTSNRTFDRFVWGCRIRRATGR
jgi:hypothetical protein